MGIRGLNQLIKVGINNVSCIAIS